MRLHLASLTRTTARAKLLRSWRTAITIGLSLHYLSPLSHLCTLSPLVASCPDRDIHAFPAAAWNNSFKPEPLPPRPLTGYRVAGRRKAATGH